MLHTSTSASSFTDPLTCSTHPPQHPLLLILSHTPHIHLSILFYWSSHMLHTSTSASSFTDPLTCSTHPPQHPLLLILSHAPHIHLSILFYWSSHMLHTSTSASSFTDPLTCSTHPPQHPLLLILSHALHIHLSILVSHSPPAVSCLGCSLLTMSLFHAANGLTTVLCIHSPLVSLASFCHTTFDCTSSHFPMLHSPKNITSYTW